MDAIMTTEQLFRWLFTLLFLGAFSIPASFRRRARHSGETIPRMREGSRNVQARALIGAPLYLAFMAYLVHPQWMAWSSLALPVWLRWAGVVGGILMLSLLYWVMRSICRNVSETFLTTEHHELVTLGPYRWVRHPLYTVATISLVCLAVVAANWFMLLMALIAICGIALFVVPREGAELIGKFGGEYRDYRRRAG